MGTYHWDVSSTSESGAIVGHALSPLGAAPPAGSVIRRFMLRNCMFIGNNEFAPGDRLSQFVWTHKVTVTTEHDFDKAIYTSARGLPTTGLGFYNSDTGDTITGLMITCGDLEIGFNQRCAYGRQTDTVIPEIVYTGSIFGGAELGISDLSGYLQYEFAVLYETFP